jgi:hypothetical protein
MRLFSICCTLVALCCVGIGFAQETEPPSVSFGTSELFYTKFDGQGFIPLSLSSASAYPINVTLTSESFAENQTITFEAGSIGQSFIFPIESFFSTSNILFTVSIQSISPNGTLGNITSVNVHIQYRSTVYLSGGVDITTPQEYFANVTLDFPSNQTTTVSFEVSNAQAVNLSDYPFINFNSTSVTIPAGETWAVIPFTYGPEFVTSSFIPNLTIHLTGSDIADLGEETEQEFFVTFPSPVVSITQETLWALSNEEVVRVPVSVEPAPWEDMAISFLLRDLVANVATVSTSTVPARQSLAAFNIPVETNETPQADRWWIVTVLPSHSYTPGAASVNITVADEIVYFTRSRDLEATPSGELNISFALKYVSAIHVSVKYSISDESGILNYSYATIPAGSSEVQVNLQFPANDQAVNLTYFISIENALNSTVSDSAEYPRQVSIRQPPVAQPTIAPPTSTPTDIPVPTDKPNNNTNDTTPTKAPTFSPTFTPTNTPTEEPTSAPTFEPAPIVEEPKGKDKHRRNVIIGATIGGFFGLIIIVAVIITIISLQRKKQGKPHITMETFGIGRAK